MNWFEKLTGLRETSPTHVRQNLTVDGATLVSLANNEHWKCGRLETPSLAELRDRVRSDDAGSGKMLVREIVADVQALHADGGNAGSMFQVASQFNLLEMVSPSVTPDQGVGIYENDQPWAKASKKSWKDDEERAKPVKAFFKGKRLRDVNPMLIEQFKQLRLNTRTGNRRTRASATVNRELQVISKVFSMAYDNGLVETNPMRRVRKLREAPARERYLTDDEEKRLFEALVGGRAYVQPIVIVALQTGMRQGEILGLKWEHLDFDQKTIYVAHTKTGRPRKVPMSTPVEVELRSLKQDAPRDAYVFGYPRTGMKAVKLRHAWERACAKAEIFGIRFHDLRHTFATRLRAKGVHEMDIMSLLGHTTLQMTTRYTHAMPQSLRTAVDALNKQPLPFRPRPSVSESAPKSRQVATGTEGTEIFVLR